MFVPFCFLVYLLVGKRSNASFEASTKPEYNLFAHNFCCCCWDLCGGNLTITTLSASAKKGTSLLINNHLQLWTKKKRVIGMIKLEQLVINIEIGFIYLFNSNILTRK